MGTTEVQSSLELCLDFSNTVDWRNGRQGKTPKDNLQDYENLLDWSKKHGLFRREEAERLGRLTRESGKDKSAFKRAIELREVIYRIFTARAHGKKPDEHDLEALNGFVSEGMARSRITRAAGGFRWSWKGTEATPDRMLWPIAKSAADLLMSERLVDVRECANEEEGCGWLFLDESKNHSRRWCDMEGCGNRAKARKYYEVHSGASA